MLGDVDKFAGGVIHDDFRAHIDEVELVRRFVVLTHVFVALRAARVIVERDARAYDVEERGAAMFDSGLDQRHELGLIAGKAARHERGTELQREPDHVQR